VEHEVAVVISPKTTATSCSTAAGAGPVPGPGGSGLREELADAGDDLGAVQLDAAQHGRVGERAGRVLEVEPAGPEEPDRAGDLARDGLGRADVERPVAHVVGEAPAVVGGPAALAADAVVHG